MQGKKKGRLNSTQICLDSLLELYEVAHPKLVRGLRTTIGHDSISKM
jgi:hypothetical protein